MIRPGVEIAKSMAVFAALTDEQVAELVDGGSPVRILGLMLSRGEEVVLVFAAAAERMLERCDRETVDAMLERLDRVRAGMVR